MISGDAPIRRSNCGAQNTHGAPTSTATVSPRMMAWTPATAAAAGSFSPMRRATIAVVERLSPSPMAKTRLSSDSVRPTVATASAPSRPTQNTSTTAKRDSSTISRIIGMASSRMARLRLPLVKSWCEPRNASRMELQIGGGGAAGTMTWSVDIKALALSICAHDKCWRKRGCTNEMVENRGNQNPRERITAIGPFAGCTSSLPWRCPGATETTPASLRRFLKLRHSSANRAGLASKIPAKAPGVGCELGLRDPPDQVFLLEFRFGPDGEGVQEVQRQRVPQRFVLSISQFPLAKNLHPHDGMTVRAHFAHHAHDGIRPSVHIGPQRIDAHKMDVHPGRFGGALECLDAVARTAMRPDDALLLGFRQYIHHRLVWMPVLPSRTVSEALNFPACAGNGKVCFAAVLGSSQTAPAAYAARCRNSRRFI